MNHAAKILHSEDPLVTIPGLVWGVQKNLKEWA
jgi:hypothetical protein